MIRLLEGDALAVLRDIPDATYTCVVTDPPYGLSTPPDPLEVMRQWLADGDFVKKSRGKATPAKGFMGAEWDHFVPGPVLWREVGRTCKPGAIVLCFSATRTMDWMMLSLRCAGFEIIDVIAWMQAQGMAKAGTIDKKIDARNGDERPVIGPDPEAARRNKTTPKGGTNGIYGTFDGEQTGPAMDLTAPASAESAAWAGWSTQLAPGYEPIIVARWPCEGTATANVLKHGCGAMNIDACRIGSPDKLVRPAVLRTDNAVLGQGLGAGRQDEPGGRWPKNVLLSSEAAEVLDLQVGERKSGARKAGAYGQREEGDGHLYAPCAPRPQEEIKASTGGPSRFFWVGPLATEDDTASPARYVPKVRTGERNAGLPDGVKCAHPTMKPGALMEWLCRLVGHPAGRGLDPFAGSGSTLRAARNLGLTFDGIERDPKFAEVARWRSGVNAQNAPATPSEVAPPCEDPPTSAEPDGLRIDAVSDTDPEDSHADNVRNAWCIASLAAGTVDRRVRAGRPVADVDDSLTQLRDSLSRIDLLTRGVGPEDDGPVQAIASKRVLDGCRFAVTEARTSKGPEWWAGFATVGEPFAVSEVSREDAVAKARAFMAAHGWRDDMGAEVGLLLVRQYDRGRDDESTARGGIRLCDDGAEFGDV